MDRCIFRTIVCLFFVVCPIAQRAHADEEISPLDADGRVVDFQRDIAPILVKRCLECHGPEDAKNDFRVDDQETMMMYVEPEDLDASTMYVDYLITDSEDELMPPKSKGGPLSASELALIRVWIEEGAHWPEGATVAAPDQDTPEKKEPAPVPQSLAQRVWAFQGFLHPATVHFPIALLMFGAFFVILGVKWPAVGTQIPLACLLLGAPAAIAATLMGLSFATQQGYPGWTTVDFDKEWFWHRWSGVIVAVVATILALIALISLRREETKLTAVWKVGLLVVAGMVGAVGHQGGELTYGKTFYQNAFDILLGKSEENEPPVVETADAQDSEDSTSDEQPKPNDLSQK